MLAFDSVTHRDLLSVQDQLRVQLRTATALEQAAQLAVESLCTNFKGQAALARCFLTLPFADLPEELRRKAWSVVEAQSLQSQMSATTPILALLGTCGVAAGWCDRRASRDHAAIPLCSRAFVDSIPMVARMLQEMGVDLGLRVHEDQPLVQKVLAAGWVGLFHVADARTARDDRGRRVIPATEFIEQYGIRTVFGLGKAYSTGSILTLVVFTTTMVSRERVEALVPFLNLIRSSTIDLVSAKRIFAPPPTVDPAS